MLEKGYLATNAFYATLAHTEKHVDDYLEALDEVFELISHADKNNKIQSYLKGQSTLSDFKRLV